MAAISEWTEGQLLNDEYLVVRQLGQGGMGIVYLVKRLGIGGCFAVKTIPAQTFSSEQGQRTLARELQTLVDLPDFPHLTAYRFFRTIDGRYALFTEFVESGSLEQWIKDRKLGNVDEILDVSVQCAWALQAVHAWGLVHQDVKPDNVLLTEERIVKVSDFGLARARAAVNLGTKNPSIKATPQYRSPEQANGRRVGHETDIWSWGLTVLAMFTRGATWMYGEVAPEVFNYYLENKKNRPDWLDMPESLIVVLKRCFCLNPNDRWSSMAEIATSTTLVYQHATGCSYPRKAPQLPPSKLPSTPHDRISTTGIQWDNPRKWLIKVLEAEGRNRAEIDQLAPPQNVSRKASVISDLTLYDEARGRLEALVAAGHTNLDPELAKLCIEQAKVHEATDNFSGAKHQYDRAIAIFERLLRQDQLGFHAASLAKACLSKGKLLSVFKRQREAIDCYNRVIEIHEHVLTDEQKEIQRDQLGMAYTNRGNALAMSGKHKAALPDYERSIHIYAGLVEKGRHENLLELARAFVNKANVVGALGRHRAAIELYDRAIEFYDRSFRQFAPGEKAHELTKMFRHEANSPQVPLFNVRKYELALACLNKAATHETLGELPQARDAATRATPIYEQMFKEEGRWEVAHDLARAYMITANTAHRLGNTKAALATHEQAIDLLEKLVRQQGIWELSNALGMAYFNKAETEIVLGNAQSAVELCDKAVEIYEHLVKREGRTELHHELATAYLKKATIIHYLGMHDEAITFFDYGIHLYDDLVSNGGHAELAGFLANAIKTKAVAVRAMGDLAGAVTLYDRSIEIYEELINKSERYELLLALSTAYLNKANTVLDLDGHYSAIDLYARCIAIRERLVYKNGRSEVAGRLAMAYLNKASASELAGDYDECVQLCERAIQLYERLIHEEGREDLDIDLARARVNRCMALLAKGKYQEALRDVRQPLELLRCAAEHTGRADLRAFVYNAERGFTSSVPSTTKPQNRTHNSPLSLFKCTNADCVFEAHVSDTPAHADAMQCPVCEDLAILVDPARPAFKCSLCQHLFRASHSKNISETCPRCGGPSPAI